MGFYEDVREAAAAFGMALTEAQAERLDAYYTLLLEWNAKMNLTAITAPREVAVKHIVDSLSAFDGALFSDGARVIDVGTGAGFPGIPLRVFCPSIRLTLLDSLQKRVRFLETVVSSLGLSDVVCVHARAEEAARRPDMRAYYDVAVSRAVAPLAVLAEYTLPFVRAGGALLALKGARYREEIEDAREAVRLLGGGAITAREVKLPDLDDRRAVVRIEKTGETPPTYPRKAGLPGKKPLGAAK